MMVIAIKHGDFPVRYVKYPELRGYGLFFLVQHFHGEWLLGMCHYFSGGLLWQDASCFLP